MKNHLGFIVLFSLIVISNVSCITEKPLKVEIVNDSIYFDEPFIQEIHKAYNVGLNNEDNEISDIAIDRNSNVWVTTAGGVFYKPAEDENWVPVIAGKDRGPAYSVTVNLEGTVLLGTWNGVYSWADGKLFKIEGVEPPISVVCSEEDMTFALGPYGIWQLENGTFQKQPYKIARSVRDAITDKDGTIWVATDAGLYACKNGEAELFQDDMISCYANAVSKAPGNKIWVGVMGGVSIRNEKKLEKNLLPNKGIPSIFVNSLTLSPDSVMWVGTDMGVVRYAKDGSHSLRFSKRWLADNKVNDVAFDKDGNAWIATANGVSEISRNTMTLAEKQDYFYNQLMKKHIREPWICGVLRLETPGDTSKWRNTDDDNDGEYTGGYLAMESFRYAVTKDEDALIKARKAFGFLSFLYEVTGTDGLFARTIVPADWKQVNDANRTYTEHQLADELVADPRYKPVEKRWHPSADGKWLWKGDTSSDEMDGHYMSYFFFYEYAATEQDKVAIRNHVSKLTTALMKNNYNLIDVDGTHTRWGVWSPEQLNRDPDWSSEKSLNSFELLAYLKFAAAITGDEKFENEYRRLIEEEDYLDNASKLNNKNPAWKIYFDLTMEGYLFPILLKYEKDAELKKFYENLANEWMKKQTAGENLINNLTYALATGKKVNVPQTIEFLKDTPLDLVDWTIDHTLREDVQIVREPILEEVQISELPPASIRATVRWDKNPWAAIQGNPQQVREPVFWLWPYWMARYLEIIKNENQ